MFFYFGHNLSSLPSCLELPLVVNSIAENSFDFSGTYSFIFFGWFMLGKFSMSFFNLWDLNYWFWNVNYVCCLIFLLYISSFAWKFFSCTFASSSIEWWYKFFTSLRNLGRWFDCSRLHLGQKYSTLTSIAMEAFALIFWKSSGVQHWLYLRYQVNHKSQSPYFLEPGSMKLIL